MEESENGDGPEGSENDRMDSDGENSYSDDHVNTNRNGLPVFTENVGVIPDMMGKIIGSLSLTVFSRMSWTRQTIMVNSHTKTISPCIPEPGHMTAQKACRTDHQYTTVHL